MELTPDDFDDLRAQIAAHKFLINALLIAPTEKGPLTSSDVTVLIEASVARLDAAGDPFLAKVVPYIEEFRAAFPFPPIDPRPKRPCT
jgi:hypothetical protein